MRRIRILLTELPRMLAEIVERIIAKAPDLEVIPASRGSLIEALERWKAEVVIVGVETGESTRSFDELLYCYPRLKLLALGGDAREATLYELRPHARSLGNVSPEELLDAIRSARGGVA